MKAMLNLKSHCLLILFSVLRVSSCYRRRHSHIGLSPSLKTRLASWKQLGQVLSFKKAPWCCTKRKIASLSIL